MESIVKESFEADVESAKLIEAQMHSLGHQGDDGVHLGSTSRIVNFYENRSVLITGASGFIGKVLIEKLLRSCPGIRRIYVLIRPKRQLQPSERLSEFLRVPLFDHAREQGLDKKIQVVSGDVTQVNLGLSSEDLAAVINDVSVIFHSAATIKFDEPLKQSVAINIRGTKYMIDLCRKLPQLAAMVHVSTAYANCDLSTIEEHLYPVKFDPENLMEMSEWLDQDTLQELKDRLLEKKPNTYTYTKSLAEWLFVKLARDLPIVICRPSIVVASWREPFSGWIDNVNGPTGILLGAGKGIIRTMLVQTSCVADLVPVDVVINLMMTLGWFANAYSSLKRLNDSTESLPTESIAGCELPSSEGSMEGSFTSGEHMASSSSEANLELESDQIGHNFNHSFKKQDTKSEQTGQQFPDEGYGSAAQASSSSSSASSSSSVINAQSDDYHDECRDTQQPNVLSFVAQQRLAEQKDAELERKLRQFRQDVQAKYAAKNLPEGLADIPVFHCTSGATNPITWGIIQIIVLRWLKLFPSITTYRYPGGSFTGSKFSHAYRRILLHYIPGLIADMIIKLLGGKPILVKIYKKFDQAANVLKSFSMREWQFEMKNIDFLKDQLMSDEDRSLFNFDLRALDWNEYLKHYVLGVRRYMLKEPYDNLLEARKNLNMVYYRNLGLQIVGWAVTIYYARKLITF